GQLQPVPRPGRAPRRGPGGAGQVVGSWRTGCVPAFCVTRRKSLFQLSASLPPGPAGPGPNEARGGAFGLAPAASPPPTATSAATKPQARCEPSQKGLFFDAPQRHSAIASLPGGGVNSLP